MRDRRDRRINVHGYKAHKEDNKELLIKRELDD